MGEKRDRPDGKTRDNHQKKVKLKYSKCTFCRRDKKGCEPPDRAWPEQKCHRCEEKGFECSANESLKKAATSNTVSTNGVAHADAGISDGQDLQDLAECQTLSLKLSWIQRIESGVARIRSLLVERQTFLPAELRSMIEACNRERSHIVGQISQLLQSDAPLVREAVFPLLPMATDCFLTTRTSSKVDLSPLQWILKTVPLSFKTDIELSVRECLLVRADPFSVNLGYCDEFMRYRDACQRYMERLEQIDHWEDRIISPRGTNFPLSGPEVLSVMTRCFPEMSFPGSDIFGRNFLQAAVETCEENDIKSFIGNIDADDFFGMAQHRCSLMKWSVLHIVAMRSMNCIFEMMLNMDPELFDSMINAKDYCGSTPLHYAMRNKDSVTAGKILALGADPSIVDDDKHNALHHAVIEGHQDLVRYLISSSTTLYTAFDDEGLTPFHLAIKYDNLGIARLFPPDSLLVPGAGEPPLSMATKKGNIPIIRWLLDREMFGGAYHLDVNCRNRDGDTALHLAVSAGNLEAVNLLLHGGADIDISNASGRTPRGCAQYFGHFVLASCMEAYKARHL